MSKETLPSKDFQDRMSDADFSITTPLCIQCGHYNVEEACCLAFPYGIPKVIMLNQVDHHKPYEGDNGIQFRQKNPATRQQ